MLVMKNIKGVKNKNPKCTKILTLVHIKNVSQSDIRDLIFYPLWSSQFFSGEDIWSKLGHERSYFLFTIKQSATLVKLKRLITNLHEMALNNLQSKNLSLSSVQWFTGWYNSRTTNYNDSMSLNIQV